jgi:hypothetical protein
MSMYLPNTALHPTGYEPGEFLDTPDRALVEVRPDTHGARDEEPVAETAVATRVDTLGGLADGTPPALRRWRPGSPASPAPPGAGGGS